MNKRKKFEIDMCNGPLAGKLFLFYIPLMLSSMLQLFFNAADTIVVGQFAGKEALAAVGSTGALINLLTNLFIGLSVGANVMVARYYGAGQKKDMSEMVHTAVAASLISGLLLMLLGITFAHPALSLMGTPEDVIDLATLYMKIYFSGMPFIMAYNFGSAILRAVGDTRRPLWYLLFSGIINVALNLVFVIALGMSVAGVALATIISQAISAVLVLRCLMKTPSDYQLFIKQLCLKKDKVEKMLRIGLPAGIQGFLFSFSNVIIQSSVNSFGKIAMSGNAAASNIEGFIYMAMNGWSQTAISFAGQNYGASKYDRVKRSTILCLIFVFFTGLIMGNGAFFFGHGLLSLYNSAEDVISFGMIRIMYICTIYFLCGLMDVAAGTMRGIGYSILPTLVSLTGACLFRIIWISTVFKANHSLEVLYVSYPISWLLTFTAHLICFIVAYKKMTAKVETYVRV